MSKVWFYQEKFRSIAEVSAEESSVEELLQTLWDNAPNKFKRKDDLRSRYERYLGSSLEKPEEAPEEDGHGHCGNCSCSH